MAMDESKTGATDTKVTTSGISGTSISGIGISGSGIGSSVQSGPIASKDTYKIDLTHFLQTDKDAMGKVRKYAFFHDISFDDAVSRLVKLISYVDNQLNNPFYALRLKKLNDNPYSQENRVSPINNVLISDLEQCVKYNIGPAILSLGITLNKSGTFATIRVKLCVNDIVLIDTRIDGLRLGEQSVIKETSGRAMGSVTLKLVFNCGVRSRYFIISNLTGIIGVSSFTRKFDWGEQRCDLNLKPTTNFSNSIAPISPDQTSAQIIGYLTTIEKNLLKIVSSSNQAAIKTMFKNIITDVSSTESQALSSLAPQLEGVASSSNGLSTASQVMTILGDVGAILTGVGTMSGSKRLAGAGQITSGLFGVIGCVLGMVNGTSASKLTTELNNLLNDIDNTIQLDLIKQLITDGGGVLSDIQTVLSNLNTAAQYARNWSRENIKTTFGFWNDSIDGSQGTAIFGWFGTAQKALSYIVSDSGYFFSNNQWNLGKGFNTLAEASGCFGQLMLQFCKLGALVYVIQLSFQGMLARFKDRKDYGEKYAANCNVYSGKLATYKSNLIKILHLDGFQTGYLSAVGYCIDIANGSNSDECAFMETFWQFVGIEKSSLPGVSVPTYLHTGVVPHAIPAEMNLVPYLVRQGESNTFSVAYQLPHTTDRNGWVAVPAEFIWRSNNWLLMTSNTDIAPGWSYMNRDGSASVNADVRWILVTYSDGFAYFAQGSHGTWWLGLNGSTEVQAVGFPTKFRSV